MPFETTLLAPVGVSVVESYSNLTGEVEQ